MGFPIAARFAHPDAGYKGDQDQAAEHLETGRVYMVQRLEVDRSSSRLFLDIPGAPVFGFNTVLFEAAEAPNDWDDDTEEADDELPSVCSSTVEIYGARFACGEPPGHLGKHYFQADGRGALPKTHIEWDDNEETCPGGC